MFDQMIKETCEGGKSQWKPEKTARNSQPNSWSLFERSSMTLTEYKMAKKKVAGVIREICSRFSYQQTGGFKVEIKSTEDISYGIIVSFKIKGNDTTIALFYSTLNEEIQKAMGDDLSSVSRSRNEHAVVVVFDKPIMVEVASFALRFAVWVSLLVCLLWWWYGGE